MITRLNCKAFDLTWHSLVKVNSLIGLAIFAVCTPASSGPKMREIDSPVSLFYRWHSMHFRYLVCLVLLASACSKKDKASSTIDESVSGVATALTKAYPGSLAISVFPTTTSTSLTADDAAPESLKEKDAEAKAFLEGTAEHCIPPSLFRPVRRIEESCYEFDQDMIYGTKDTHVSGTKDGKSTISGSSEACLVSFARAQVKAIEEIIDQGLGLQQAMICQAAKDGVDAAAAATATGVDLAKNLTEAGEKAVDPRKPKIEVSTAKMLKDADGVYRVSIDVSITKESKTTTQTYNLAHVPDSEDNSSYHGVMSISRQEPANPGNPTEGKRYISVSYTRTMNTDGSSQLKTELRAARLASALDSQAFNDDGTLNYNAGADADGNFTGISNPQNAISSQLLTAFDLNVTDNTGTFEYWQNPGSNYSEAARGMIFKLEKNATTGRLEGCGMSGAALGTTAAINNSMSIRKSIKTGTALAVTGSYHPFFSLGDGGTCSGTPETCTKTLPAPNNLSASWEIPAFSVGENATAAQVWAKNQVSPIVIRQCVAQNDQGDYLIDTAAVPDTAGYMLFNPTNATDLVIAKPERPKGPPPGPALR